MKPSEIALDRAMIAEAASENKVLAWEDGHIRLLESNQLVKEDRIWYTIVDDLRYEFVCLARDLDEIAPALPKIRVAFCPTAADAERVWMDSSVQLVVVQRMVFGPLGSDGRSRSTAHGVTVTQESHRRWTVSVLTLAAALGSTR